MKRTLSIFLIFIFLIIQSGCDKENETDRGYPGVNTLDVTNISDEGAVFNAEITGNTGYNILKYGFVWSISENPDLEHNDKVIRTTKPESNKFSAAISTTLIEGRKYYVRPFIITGDYTVYGKIVEFKSLGSKAPVFESFSPLTGTWGDTIRISGKNFSYISEENNVRMGNIICKLLSVTDSLLKIAVPQVRNDPAVKLNVSVSGNSSVSKDYFTYLIPKISEVSPLNGTFREVIQIDGENFGYFKENVTVKIGGILSPIVSVSPEQIKVTIPESLKTMNNSLQVTAVGNVLNSDKKIILKAPVITSFLPDTVYKPNSIITLYGENFSPVLKNNEVFIGGFTASVQEAAGSYLKVVLPYESIPNYYTSIFKNLSVIVKVSEQSSTAGKSLSLWWHSTWTQKKDFPGKGRHDAVAFAINNKGYFGTGVTCLYNTLLKDFWEYDPETDHWTQITDFPGNARAASVAFAIGGKGYVGTGSENYYPGTPAADRNHFKDFYSFDPLTAIWTRVADFAGVGRHSAACFVISDIAYVGTGWWGNDHAVGIPKSADDFWKYNPADNSWTAAQNFPVSSYMAVGFNIDNSGYVYDYNYLYRNDGNSWRKLIAPGLTAWDNLAFSINGLAYFGLGAPHSFGTNALYEYNPVTQTSLNKPMEYVYNRSASSAFIINNKAYIVSGLTYNGEEIDLKDVWEFDPSLPKL